MDNNLELRMYSLVMYNLSPIQQAIQAYHATIEATNNFHNPNSISESEFKDWAKNWKTVIILNGGSSVTMKEHRDTLWINDIGFSDFREPDLNDSLSAISFIVNERVFNKIKYPDYLLENTNIIGMTTEKDHKYDLWVESIGGAKNSFLRNWVKNFRLA